MANGGTAMEGMYALADPQSSFNMNSEYNLFSQCSNLTGTVSVSYPDIQDEPKEIVEEKKKTSWWAVAGFIAATIVVGAIAVACAPVSAAVAITCIGVCAVTAAGINLAIQVHNDGWDNVDWGAVIISGCCGAMSASFALISWPASSKVIGSTIGAATVSTSRWTQGLFNGMLGVTQTAASGGSFWEYLDSFAVGFVGGTLGGPGYTYVNTLHFYQGIVIKDVIFNGLAKGYLYGNGGTIISSTMAEIVDHTPLKNTFLGEIFVPGESFSENICEKIIGLFD